MKNKNISFVIIKLTHIYNQQISFLFLIGIIAPRILESRLNQPMIYFMNIKFHCECKIPYLEILRATSSPYQLHIISKLIVFWMFVLTKVEPGSTVFNASPTITINHSQSFWFHISVIKDPSSHIMIPLKSKVLI